MTTGTSTSTTACAQHEVWIEDYRGWINHPGVPTDITPTSTGPLEIAPTANRLGGTRTH